MKKLFKMAAVCFTAAALVSCDGITTTNPEDPDKNGQGDNTTTEENTPTTGLTEIKGTIVNFSTFIEGSPSSDYDLVLIGLKYGKGEGQTDQEFELARTAVGSTGAFTLALPAQPLSDVLVDFSAEGQYMTERGIPVSDPDNAYTTSSTELVLVRKSDGYRNDVRYNQVGENTGKRVDYSKLIFVSGAVDVTGSFQGDTEYNENPNYTFVYDVHFPIGWGWLFNLIDGATNTYTITTTLPEGYGMEFVVYNNPDPVNPDPVELEEPDYKP